MTCETFKFYSILLHVTSAISLTLLLVVLWLTLKNKEAVTR